MIAAKATCAAITEALVPDAATIACLSDPGLLRIRQGVIFPVVGIAAVAMSRAVELGPRYSILTVAPTTVPGIRALADRGLQSQNTGDQTPRDMTELARKVLVSNQPDVIVLGGAITAGTSHHLAPELSIPVLDGLSCIIRLAGSLATHEQRLRI